VLLPEMPFADWLPAREDVSADDWEAAVEAHARDCARLVELAPAAVIGTRPVVDAGRRLNRGFVVEGRGESSGWRDKYYLPDEPGYWEASWYERGSGDFGARDVAGLRVGLQICTEMWFLQRSREYGQGGAHLLVVPRATPRARTSRWIAGGRAAAVVSGAYCASSNLHEPEGAGPADLGGSGWVIDPEGEVLALTSVATPFVTVEIDREVAAAAKRGYPRYVAD
jgi:N-carbamoylputrescine amidase